MAMAQIPESGQDHGAPVGGLVWAFQFAVDGTASPLSEDVIEATLAASPVGWVWLHFALTDARGRGWIAKRAPLSEHARKALLGSDDHLHLDVIGREIIGALPDLHRELTKAGEDLGRLRFVLTERMLISVRRTPLHGVEATRRAVESGRRFAEAIGLIDAIMDQFTDAVSELMQRYGEELDQVEHHLTRDELGEERQRLARIRLRTVRIQRQLSHIRSLFHRIESRLPPEAHRVAISARTLALKLDSVDHEMVTVYERSRLLHDQLGAKAAELTNRRLLTLSVLQACLLPPTLVSGGYFGMNTMDLLFKETPHGSFYAALISISAGALTYAGLRLFRAL
jgi:zinc transporter